MKTTTKNHVGKGSQEEMLPHRGALTTLTQGDPIQRSLQQYAKKSPTGTDPDSMMGPYGSGMYGGPAGGSMGSGGY